MDLTAHHETLIVVDFGGQYTQLIARRARELGVFTRIVPWNSERLETEWGSAKAVILSGGPRSVTEEGSPVVSAGLLESGKPLLGICYGQQLLASALGGVVHPGATREYGEQRVQAVDGASLLEGEFVAWMSHGDTVVELPPGFHVAGTTEGALIAAVENAERKIYGVQFHPEVSHTEGGKEILRRFLYDVAGFSGDWTAANFIEESIDQIREQVGDGRVLCAVSGGVDSTVCAALVAHAIGDRLRCIFVDHGLLRYNEAEEVSAAFQEHIPAEFIRIDASEQFLTALRGVSDPEQKRKIIGAEFIRVFEAHAAELEACDFLAQGTLYPDVIESGSPTAATIKSHHNVGGLPEWMRMELVEPLRWLFKDEVRNVGRQLGLPESMINRQPFPGPGLAVRILGEITAERVRLVQLADHIFRTELREAGLEAGIWQCYAALLDVRSVGVMGDARTYEHPIVLRAVVSEDAMTARAAEIPFPVLERVARRIVNEVEGVNRVVYDLTSKPPATIEWE